jgi:hypothetical protein
MPVRVDDVLRARVVREPVPREHVLRLADEGLVRALDARGQEGARVVAMAFGLVADGVGERSDGAWVEVIPREAIRPA